MHSPEQRAADEAAIGAHRCPETGRDLKPLNAASLRHHIHSTFPHADSAIVEGTDYQRRYKLLKGYFTDRFHEEL